MSYYIHFIIVLFAQSLPCITGFLKWSYLDRAAKIVVQIALIGIISEILACLSAIIFHSNMIVYNLASLLMTLCFGNYVKCFLSPNKFLISKFLNIGTILFWCCTTYRLHSLSISNNLFVTYECLLTVTCCIIIIEILLNLPHYTSLRITPHFWFACLFIFSYILTFSQYSLYDYISARHASFKNIIDESLFVFNILQNLAFFTVFFFYPNKQSLYGKN